MQYSGKYSRRGSDMQSRNRRMPYMGVGRCSTCGRNGEELSLARENAEARNTYDTCDTCGESWRNSRDRDNGCDICELLNLDDRSRSSNDSRSCDNCNRSGNDNRSCDNCNRQSTRDSDYDYENCPSYREGWCDQDFSLAMGYVYPQEFRELNESEDALCRGTLFRELDMPFYGTRKRTDSAKSTQKG